MLLVLSRSAALSVTLVLCYACSGQGGSECELDPSSIAVEVVSRYTPIGQAANWDGDVLAIRNRSKQDWPDATVTVYGYEITNTKGKQVSGAFKSTSTKDIPAGELAAYSLADFQNASGKRWVSVTMVVDEVEVATGQPCRGSVVLSQQSRP